LVAVPEDLAARLADAKGGEATVAVIKAGVTDPTKMVAMVRLPALPRAQSTLEPGQAATLLRERLGLSFMALGILDVVAYTSARPGQQVTLSVERQGQRLEVPVVTQASSERPEKAGPQGQLITPHETIGRIGLLLGPPTIPVGVGQALKLAALQAKDSVALIVLLLKGMLTGRLAATPGGPVSILALTYEQAQLGWDQVTSFGGFISANLAVFNLLPFPPLDGFVLLVLALEGVLRRRVDARLQRVAQYVGTFLLLAVFVGLTFNDLANLIVHGTP